MIVEHHWETTSSHVTSDGWVRYQACLCGLTRITLNTEPIGVTARNDPDRVGVVAEHDYGG